ncbi:hypothetical protein SLE2022_316810 [Rubroshorea leprosula]
MKTHTKDKNKNKVYSFLPVYASDHPTKIKSTATLYLCLRATTLVSSKPATRGQVGSDLDPAFTRISRSDHPRMRKGFQLALSRQESGRPERKGRWCIIRQPSRPDPTSLSPSQAMQLQPTSVGCVHFGIDCISMSTARREVR